MGKESMPILIIRNKNGCGYFADTDIYGVLAFTNPSDRAEAIRLINGVVGTDGWDTEYLWDALSELPCEFIAFSDYDEIEI